MYYLVMPPLPPEPEQLFVLPRHEVDSSVFQQRREHKQQAHGHPDVYGLHVGHLGVRERDTNGVPSLPKCIFTWWFTWLTSVLGYPNLAHLM